jgi:hypothetical protein
MDQIYICSILNYDPNTGEFTWKVNRPPRGKAGDVAGYNNGSGYQKISIDGKRYYSHRLAFLWMTGKFPAKVVDHINGNRLDNRWENLRSVTQKENTANTTISKGVRRRYGNWQARFADKHIGTFPTKEQAVQAYKEAKINAAKLNPYLTNFGNPEQKIVRKYGHTVRTFQGKTLNQWAKELGMPQPTLHYKVVKQGIPLEKIVLGVAP